MITSLGIIWITSLGIIWLVHARSGSHARAGQVIGGFAVAETTAGPQLAFAMAMALASIIGTSGYPVADTGLGAALLVVGGMCCASWLHGLRRWPTAPRVQWAAAAAGGRSAPRVR